MIIASTAVDYGILVCRGAASVQSINYESCMCEICSVNGWMDGCLCLPMRHAGLNTAVFTSLMTSICDRGSSFHAKQAILKGGPQWARVCTQGWNLSLVSPNFVPCLLVRRFLKFLSKFLIRAPEELLILNVADLPMIILKCQIC